MTPPSSDRAAVLWSALDSPLGSLLAAVSGRGLVWLSYADHGRAAALNRLAGRLGHHRLVEAPAALAETACQLTDYFAGRRRRFELTLDLRLVGGHGFTDGVLEACAKIPYGQVATYGQVAAAAGSPGAARAAGNALASNPLVIVVPCHRVVPGAAVADGRLNGDRTVGDYGGGADRKRLLLRLEKRAAPRGRVDSGAFTGQGL